MIGPIFPTLFHPRGMGHYFYENENPHAPVRDNGKRFWGYPSRTAGAPPRLIVIHTAENHPDLKGADSGAEAIARYGATTSRPASWHQVVDSDSRVSCLPDSAVAFHVIGYNTISLGIELATQAHAWDEVDDEWRKAILDRAARKVAVWCRKHNIPVRKLSKKQVDAGWKGITAHSILDPKRRSDPGAEFPWARFLELVTSHLGKRDDSPSNASKEWVVTNGTIRAPRTLARGDSGRAVRKLKHLLAVHDGAWCGGDPEFTQAVKERVQAFQRDNGLDQDGIVGPKTWEALIEG